MGVRSRPWWWLALAVAAALLTASCGQKSGRADDWWQPHATAARTPAPGPGPGIPQVTAEEAEARLTAALAEAAHAEILIYANRVVAAGPGLSDARRSAVRQAADRVAADGLEAVWRSLDPRFEPAPRVAVRLALVARHRGDDAVALAWLDRVVLDPDGDPGLAARVEEVRREIAARAEVVPNRLAVLLPLSGRYAALGRELRTAIELAAAAVKPPVELRFLDTRGETAGAIAAVDEAVYAAHARAILGPVGQLESRAAADRAVELGIPIALLAPADDCAAPEAGVFRLWSSPAWEARQAARLAVALGYDRLAVLSPRDEQGAAQSAAFAEAAAALGVTVVARGDYDPTATELEPDLKAFLGLDPARNEALRRHLRRYGNKQGWKTFTPDVPFDLLYIPDRYDHAALVVAYLPYFNVEVRSVDPTDALYLRRKHRGKVPQVVQLMGSSGWHHPALITRGGPVVEGALVVDVFAGGEDEEFASEGGARFAERFERRTGRLPTAFAAQAYDAAALTLAAFGDTGEPARARPDFVARLRKARLRAGACGAAAIGASGEIDRAPVLLRVDGGSFVLHEH